MTYTPQTLTALVPPIPARATTGVSAWQQVLANHNDMFAAYEPTVAQWGGKPFATLTTGSDETLFRFVSEKGADFAVGGVGLSLRLEVFARRTNGAVLPAALTLHGGAAAVTVSVASTVMTKYTLTATPASSYETWTISALASPLDVVEVGSWVAYWVATAPGTRAYPSGFRQITSFWNAANRAVSTEVTARALNGPVLVARDRPVCVFSHFWRADSSGSSFGKVQEQSAWGVSVSDLLTQVVGRGRIPKCDARPRRMVVTYYMRAASNVTIGYLTIGANVHEVTANTAGAFEVELGPGDADITATIGYVGALWAYFERVQVWREEA